MRPAAAAHPGRRGHEQRAHAGPAVDEALVSEQLALQPLFNGLSRLLGQLAGLLLLASAGSEPERQRCHLAAVRGQLQAVHENLARIAPPERLAASFRAMGETLALLDEMATGLERWPAALRWDASTFSHLTAELSAARHLLLAGSAADLGIGLVDFSAACCAQAH